MPTLIQQLPDDIKRLEAKYGSDNPFVKQLKEQLRAMKANGDKSTQDVFRMQAFNFSPVDLPTTSEGKQLPDLENLPEDPALTPMRQTVKRSQESTTDDEPDSRR